MLTNVSAMGHMQRACISRAVARSCTWTAFTSQLEADKLRADLEHAQAYRVKARQAKREAQELQQQLDRVRAQAAGQAAAAASGDRSSFEASVIVIFTCPSCPTMSSHEMYLVDTTYCTAAFQHRPGWLHH